MGQDMSTQNGFCGNCGHRHESAGSFCTQCGAARQPSAPAPVPAASGRADNKETPASGTQRRSRGRVASAAVAVVAVAAAATIFALLHRDADGAPITSSAPGKASATPTVAATAAKFGPAPAGVALTPAWTVAVPGATQIFSTPSRDARFVLIAGPNDKDQPAVLVEAATGKTLWSVKNLSSYGWWDQLMLMASSDTSRKNYQTYAATTPAATTAGGGPSFAWKAPGRPCLLDQPSGTIAYLCQDDELSGVTKIGTVAWTVSYAEAGISGDDLRETLAPDGSSLLIYDYWTTNAWTISPDGRAKATPQQRSPSRAAQTSDGGWIDNSTGHVQYFPKGATAPTWTSSMANYGGEVDGAIPLWGPDGAQLVDARTGEVRWSGSLPKVQGSAYFIEQTGERTALVYAYNGASLSAAAIDTRTGAQAWQAETGFVAGMWHGAIVTTNREGAVAVLRATDGQSLGELNLPQGTWNGGHLIGPDLLLVGNKTNGTLQAVRLTPNG